MVFQFKIITLISLVVVGVAFTNGNSFAHLELEQISPDPKKEIIKADVELISERPLVGKDWQILFSDDFEKELAYSWNLSGDWSIVNDTTKVLEIGGKTPFSTALGSESWTDYSLTFKYKPISKDETMLRVNFRVDWTGQKFYSLGFLPGNKALSLEKMIRENVTILQEEIPYNFEPNRWHDINITVINDRIWIAVNNRMVVGLQDKNNPLTFGRVAFKAEFIQQSPIAHIDGVKVRGTFEKPAWVHLNAPYGGKVAKVLIDPKNPNNVFLTAEHGSVYKSTNGGKNWKPAFNGLNTVDLLVNGFAISPHDPKILLASTTDGPYRTINQAKTWQKISTITFPNDPFIFEKGTFAFISGKGTFAFSPSDPQIVYLGTNKDIEDDGITRGGLFLKSTDAGASFVGYPASAFNKNIEVLAVHPTNSEVVFAGTKHEGIYKTSDGGQTWEEKNTGLNYKYIASIEIDPLDPNKMFAIAGEIFGSSFVFKSENGGESWEEEKSLSDYRTAKALKIAPSNPNLVYVAGGTEVFISKDAGKSWSQKKEFTDVSAILDIAVDPKNPDKLIVGYTNGVLLSFDGGDTWKRSVNGLGANGIISLAVDPNNPSIVYAGDWSNGGIHKSVDYGRTWKSINSGIGEGIVLNVHDLTIDPNNSQAIYAAILDGGIFKTNDGGNHWERINNGLTSLNVAQVVISPQNSNIIYAATTKGVNYFDKSEQEDATYGVFKSVDGGREWVRVSDGLVDNNVQSIAVHPTNPDIVYAGTATGGVFKSQDGGATWTAKNNGFAENDNFIQAIVFNPINPNELYAGINQIYKSRLGEERTQFVTDGGAIYKSVDGGENWQKLELDEHIASVEKIVVDSVNPNNVYVSTHSPGVYKSSDGGVTWKPINMGMLYLKGTYGGHNYVFAMDISSDGKVLYAGSCGRGVFRTELPKDKKRSN